LEDPETRAQRTDKDLDVALRGRVELLERLLDDLAVDVARRALPARGGLVEDELDVELVRLAGGEVCECREVRERVRRGA